MHPSQIYLSQKYIFWLPEKNPKEIWDIFRNYQKIKKQQRGGAEGTVLPGLTWGWLLVQSAPEASPSSRQILHTYWPLVHSALTIELQHLVFPQQHPASAAPRIPFLPPPPSSHPASDRCLEWRDRHHF